MNDTPKHMQRKHPFPILNGVIWQRLPSLNSHSSAVGLDYLAHMKFFTPEKGWMWFVAEANAVINVDHSNPKIDYYWSYNKEVNLNSVRPTNPHLVDVLCRGVIVQPRHKVDVRTFSLAELYEMLRKRHLTIERDRTFRPTSLSKLYNCYKAQYSGDYRKWLNSIGWMP